MVMSETRDLRDAAGAGVARLAALLQNILQQPKGPALAVVLLWALAVLPNLAVRSFIWEEGTNAELARDVLANGHFLAPVVYGVPWHEKPSLLPWLIAAFSFLTGGVNEWSARLPAAISTLLTALLVQRFARQYVSAVAALVAALCFLFSPLLLQKLTIAEPDTIITALSFAAFVVWWRGVSSGEVSFGRWLACGLLMVVLAMAKGPQPAGFFLMGAGAFIVAERRWQEIPGWILCAMMPVVAIVAWGAAIYRPGDELLWLNYARVGHWGDFGSHVARNAQKVASLIVELLPMCFAAPLAFRKPDAVEPRVKLALALYAGACTVFLVMWAGFNSRYAMPIAPALAVLTGFFWDRPDFARTRRAVTIILCAFVVYQVVLVTIVMPVMSQRFGASREDGLTLARAVDRDPAPVYSTGLDTNQLFYVARPIQCLNIDKEPLPPTPAWLLMPQRVAEDLAKRRPDLEFRIVVETRSGSQLVAARMDRKS